jgi:hypothetical protein
VKYWAKSRLKNLVGVRFCESLGESFGKDFGKKFGDRFGERLGNRIEVGGWV